MKKLFKFKKRLVPKFNLNKGVFNAKHSTLAALVLLVIGAAAFSIYYKTRAQTSGGVGTVSDKGGMTITNIFSTTSGQPRPIAFTKDSKSAYIGTEGVEKVNLTSNTITKLVDHFNDYFAQSLLLSDNQNNIYFVDSNGSVYNYSISTNTSTGNHFAGCPTIQYALDPECKSGSAGLSRTGDFIYVIGGDYWKGLYKVLTSNLSDSHPNTVPSQDVNNVNYNSVVMSQNDSFAYIVNSSKLYKVNTTDNSVTSSIATGLYPGAVVLSPVSTDNIAYIYNTGDATIAKINLTNFSIDKTFSVTGATKLSHYYDGYTSMDISPDGKYLYLATSVNGKIFKVSTQDGSVVDSLALSVNTKYGIVAKVSPDNSTLIVTDATNSKVYTISLKPPVPPVTYSITKTSEIVGKTSRTAQPGDTIKYTIKYKGGVVAPPTPVVLAGFSWPIDIDISPNGSFAYVADLGNNTVAKIDTRTNTIIKKITGIVGKNSPWRIAISPNGTFAYTSNLGADTISRINTSTDTITRTISATNPGEIAISPDGSFAYIIYSNDTGTSGGIYRINTSTDTITKTIIGFSGGPSSVSISPDGSFAYVTGANSYVYRVSTSTDTIIKTISGFNRPSSVSISPDGSFAYLIDYKVGSATQGIVSRINTSTDTVTKTITDDQSPLSLAISPNGKFAYISNNSPDTISRIDISTDTIDQTISGFGTAGNLDISPDGSFAYSAGSYLGIVYRINN